uniref:Uncharacterized protein n=1 Tax=Tanacetum cinerariifolium TaxID=118510 RepID=A0A699IZS3_TANCI|nr:hypothetical protein [Tanacetum cinerariifolium]
MGDTIAQTRFENVSKLFNDSLLTRGNTLQSGEDRMKLNELMNLCTNLQTKILDLENTKTTQANKIASLKRRVKKLKRRNRSRTHKLKRFYKVGLTSRVESSDDEASLGGKEVFVEQKVVADKQEINEVTLAKALAELKSLKPKAKGVVIQEPSETTTTTIPKQQSHDKGKGILVEEPVKPKKKDQIRLDEEAALRLQAKFDEEQRLAREKTQQELEANIDLIETWDDVQAKLMLIIN